MCIVMQAYPGPATDAAPRVEHILRFGEVTDRSEAAWAPSAVGHGDTSVICSPPVDAIIKPLIAVCAAGRTSPAIKTDHPTSPWRGSGCVGG